MIWFYQWACLFFSFWWSSWTHQDLWNYLLRLCNWCFHRLQSQSLFKTILLLLFGRNLSPLHSSIKNFKIFSVRNPSMWGTTRMQTSLDSNAYRDISEAALIDVLLTNLLSSIISAMKSMVHVLYDGKYKRPSTVRRRYNSDLEQALPLGSKNLLQLFRSLLKLETKSF